MTLQDFYSRHRGGSGLVIIAFACQEDEQKTAVFGSIDAAEAWRQSLGNAWTCVFSPYVVDDPDFGNRTLNS